mgnify:CR=1 FL=1
MSITSDKNYVSGQPRIDGHRIWVSHIISHVREMGLDSYIDDFDLEGEEDHIIEALDYCRNERCVGNVVSYCQGCSKHTSSSGEDLWNIAAHLYQEHTQNE